MSLSGKSTSLSQTTKPEITKKTPKNKIYKDTQKTPTLTQAKLVTFDIVQLHTCAVD